MKRPLLTTEDRDRLRAMADKAQDHTFDPSPNRAYAQGVRDTLDWLASNADMSPLLQEVTR